MMNFICLFIGSFVLFALRLNEAWKKPEFKWGYFFKWNIMPALIAIGFGIVAILDTTSVEAFFTKISPSLDLKINGFTCFLIGIVGDVLLKKALGVMNKNKPTVVGVNP